MFSHFHLKMNEGFHSKIWRSRYLHADELKCKENPISLRYAISSTPHDNTLNLPVVAQQPHPDPNYAPHAAARRAAGA